MQKKETVPTVEFSALLYTQRKGQVMITYTDDPGYKNPLNFEIGKSAQILLRWSIMENINVEGKSGGLFHHV